MYTQTREIQKVTTPARALKMLLEGNQRFRERRALERDLPQQARDTAEGEYPSAFVLGCSDSRVPPEVIFDQGLGDLGSLRVVGNGLGDDSLGGMEFAAKVLGAKLIVVLGHSNCQAVKHACEHSGPDCGPDSAKDEFGGLFASLWPSVQEVQARLAAAGEGPHAAGHLVDEVARDHVRRVVAEIRERSRFLRERVVARRIALVGAMYEVHSGEVKLLTPAPE